MAVKKKGAMSGCSIKNGCKSKLGGLTAKGRKMINRKTGSNLKAPQPGSVNYKKLINFFYLNFFYIFVVIINL